MNKWLSGCLMTIMLLIFSVWGFNAIRKYMVKQDFQKQLQSDFKNKGYKGKLSVVAYNTPLFISHTLTYRYEENVEGKTLDFEGSLSVDPHTKKIENAIVYNWFDDDVAEPTTDADIIKTAMWKQPYVEKKLKYVKQSFKKLERDKIVISDVSGRVSDSIRQGDNELTKADIQSGQRQLFDQFKKNKRKHLPVNGYHTINVPSYLKNHSLEISIDFEILVDDLDAEEDALIEKFLETTKQLDYGRFWDGYYTVSLSYRDTLGGTKGDITDGIVLDIRDGKIYRTFAPL